MATIAASCGNIHDIEHFPALPDEPPFIANPVDDVIFEEFPQRIDVSLDGVVSDPDDPDENIIYSLVSNSNESGLAVSLSGHRMRLTRLSSEEGEAVLVLQATSHGQSIEFEINVVMHYVYDAVDEDAMEMISVYPNPTQGVIFVGAKSVQRVEVFNVTGQMVMSSTEPVINVSELGSGLYIVRVTADDRMVIRSIVKQ